MSDMQRYDVCMRIVEYCQSRAGIGGERIGGQYGTLDFIVSQVAGSLGVSGRTGCLDGPKVDARGGSNCVEVEQSVVRCGGADESASESLQVSAVGRTDFCGCASKQWCVSTCHGSQFVEYVADHLSRNRSKGDIEVESSAVHVAEFPASGSKAESSHSAVGELGAAESKTKGGCVQGIVQEPYVSERTLYNREKRAKKKERKLRKQTLDADVPEWRKKNGSERKDQRSGDGVDYVDGLRSSAWVRTGGRRGESQYKGAFGSCSQEIREKLAETRARRFIAENEACVRKAQAEEAGWERVQKTRRKREALQLIKTEQEYELVRSRDMDQMKKRQETRVIRDTEVNKVAVEKAFGTLAMTGNIPSLVGGTVQTVVSGSISPNSSVSEAEIRKLQKDYLDLKEQNEQLVKKLKDRACYGDDIGEGSIGLTVDEDGLPIGDFGDCIGGYVGRDGRFHQGENYDLW